MFIKLNGQRKPMPVENTKNNLIAINLNKRMGINP
jgi:hypothetical protein